MKLTKCDANEIKNNFKRTKWQKMLEEFLESDMDCAKVEEYTNKDAKSCVGALYLAIKRFRMTGVRAALCNGEVYLIRVNELREKED